MTTNTVPGISALQCVISSLRDTAHLSDEGGELTDQLRELRDWALSTAAHPTAGIWVPTELAERVQETMGEFLMDHGWRQQDMDTSDEFGALLAVATKAAPKSAPVAQGDARAEQALLKVLTAVQRYLPPDGPSAKDTLAEIIGIIDPWPLGDQKGKA